MGRTRGLFKKIRDTKGIFQAKTGTIKDKNGMDITEAEDIKKSGKNTQKNYTKKGLNDPDNDDHSPRARHPGMLNQVDLRKHAAAAAKSLQSCLTLCDPTDGSPPASAVPRILQARTLEWVAISFSNA